MASIPSSGSLMATHNYRRSKGRLGAGVGLGWRVSIRGSLPGVEDVAPAEMELSSGLCFQLQPHVSIC